MERVIVHPRDVPAGVVPRRTLASLGHVGRVVAAPSRVEAGDGELLALALPLGRDAEPLENALRSLSHMGQGFGTSSRTSGLKNTGGSRTFGYSPRVPLRRDFCAPCALAADHPALNRELLSWDRVLGEMFAAHLPEQASAQRGVVVENVRPEWRFGSEFWTSGIANWNNPLAYHRDAGNFKGTWSAMIVLKRACEGGELVVPEWDAALEVADRTVTFFNGARWLHGVAPFAVTGARSWRYSVVFYALAGMRFCQGADEELRRIREVKTGREASRSRLTPEELRKRVKR